MTAVKGNGGGVKNGAYLANEPRKFVEAVVVFEGHRATVPLPVRWQGA